MADALPTLTHYFHERISKDRARPALYIHRGDNYHAITWDHLGRDVFRAAAVLRDLGVQPGDRVVQVSENRYEWIVADLAIQQLRAVDVAVHSILSGPQIAYQIADCEAKVVLLSNQDQANKLADQVGRLSSQIQYLCYGNTPLALGGRPVEPIGGRMYSAAAGAVQSIYQDARHASPDDLVTILYTSGTTGEPKGVMLSQRNLTTNAATAVETFGSESGILRLCWLPLSHIFARTCDCYIWLVAGNRLALARNRDTVLDDCKLLQPDRMSGVPYFYDKVCRLLQDRGDAEKPGALRELLGGKIRSCVSGGAALPDYLAKFFFSQDVPLLQGYGLTESSPVITMSTEESYKIGTSGRPIRDVEVRIAEDGEVLTRGPHVMVGYWKKPDATAETVQDGWLRTGDLGAIDEDGFLKITGRKKELIVTAAGKNVAPVLIESLLTEDPIFDQVMVIGDDRPFLTALIVPGREALRRQIDQAEWNVEEGALLTDSKVLSLYRERIDTRLRELSKVEQIGKFRLIGDRFSIERDELTPTLKLRRAIIGRHYQAEIEAIYRE
jgi:long-chain acyl-CoA synthetase